MKRVMESSPVDGYQLFRFVKLKADGTTSILPKYYFRHGGKDTCTKTDRLNEAKIAVKKHAGEEVQAWRRRSARRDEVTIGALLDLVIEDYQSNNHKTLKNARAQIAHSLRPFFGEMLAATLGTEEIDRWLTWRQMHRLRKSVRGGHTKLQPASINRELSLLRRAYQLGYEPRLNSSRKFRPLKSWPRTTSGRDSSRQPSTTVC